MIKQMAGIFVDSVAQPSAKIKCIPSYENNNFRFQRETFLTSFFAEDPTLLKPGAMGSRL